MNSKTITIHITRDKQDTMIHMDFEEYIFGVVASEIGNAPIEACKAQAVAARTVALPYLEDGKAIPDTNIQAFRLNRTKDRYPNAWEAAMATQGEVLYYGLKPVAPCSFSASNGGRTTSSKARWGGERPYLIEQEDIWDLQATKGNKKGHGVGMSQEGAIYAASHGHTYEEILSFYYPGTFIHKEGSPMASVKASKLIEMFKKMATEKWKYVAGSHKYGEVDCSGAFYYAYKQLGSYMYHGSNTIWRNYTTEKGEIGKIDLVPGMAVFKCRSWTSSQASNSWYNKDPGDVYHVGLYIGDGMVVEAKGTKYGVVTTKINTWHMAAKLKNTLYDVNEQDEEQKEAFIQSKIGMVNIGSGWLNLRKDMSTSSERMGKLYNGDSVTVIGKHGNWYEIAYEDQIVYAKTDFIELVEQPKQRYCVTVDVFGEDEAERVKTAIASCGYQPKACVVVNMGNAV